MAQSNVERAKKRWEERKGKGQSASSSSATLKTNSNEAKKRWGARKIGVDTLGTDLANVGSTLESIYGGWTDQDTLKQARTSIDDVYGRLGKAKEYGVDLGFDVDSVLSAYETVLGDWDKLEGNYGYYKDADSYAKAVKQSELAEQFKGMTYDKVQEALKQYEVGSDEYEYLRNYTDYSTLEDMDKALAGLEEGAKEHTMQVGANWNELLSQGTTPSPAKRDIDAKLQQSGFDWLGANKQSKPSAKVAQTEGEEFDWAGESEKASRSHSGGSAYVSNDSLKKKLETARNQYALDHASEPYMKLMGNEDFEAKSQYVPSELEGWWNKLTDGQYGLGYGDITYEYINNVNGARDEIEHKASIYGLDTGDRASSQFKKAYHEMNDDEIRIYNYLYAKDKEEGTNTAKEYLDSIEMMLTKKATDKMEQGIESAVDGETKVEGALASTALSALSIPANVIGSVYTGAEVLTNALSGKRSNPYGYYRGLSNASSSIREEVGENIEQETSWQIGGTNVARFIYDTGMSIGDSALGVAVTGQALAPLMGATAFQQKAKEMTEAGESEEVIFQTALASGLAEMVFEHIGIDKLFKIKNSDSLRKIILNTLKQAGVEGLEEVGTEFANVLFDDLIRGENSELAQMRNELKSRGFSEEEIAKELQDYVVGKLIQAGIGGALSGGVMGGVASTNNYLGLRSDGKSIRESERMTEAFDMASRSPKESEAYKAYSTYAKKGVTADNATDAQLGNLSANLQSDAIKTAKSKKATDEERLGAFIRLKEDKLHTPKTAEEKAYEKRMKERADAKVKAGQEMEASASERMKTLPVGEVTEIASTGNATQIKGIKTEDGEAVIVTSEGEVKASEMNFSQTDAELVAYAVDMNDDERANLFIAQYDGKSDVRDYAESFNMAYLHGETGFGADTVFKYKGVLTEAQAVEIYKAGMTNKAKALQINVDKITAKYDGGEFVKGEFNDSIINYNNNAKEGQVNYKDLTSSQKRMVRFMKAFAKATGVKINLVKAEVVDGKYEGKQGSYNPKDNSIDIDIYAGRLSVGVDDAKNAIATTLSHELTHWMKHKSPALYREMQELAMSNLGRRLDREGYVEDEKMRLDNKHGEGHTDEDAIDEIVARTCEDMLSNSKTARELLSKLSPKDQKALVGKAKAYIDNVIAWVDELLGAYPAGSEEAKLLRENKEAFEQMSKMWDKALADAIKANQSMKKEGINDIALLEKNGVLANKNSATVYSVRYVLDEKTKNKVASDLANAIGVSKDDAMKYLDAETSIASIVLNPKHQEFLDYEADENEVAIKKNSDYPQGTVDFSTMCPKRGEFSSVMNRVMSKFKNHVFLSTDLAKIRTIMSEEGITIPCGICFVEDRRQLDSIVAEDFVKALELYRKGSTTRPDGKPFNANQLKALKMVGNDAYTPSIYELITLEGRNALKEKNPNMESAWMIYNNARGMQSVRLLTNEAEYRREILNYSKSEVKKKNDFGGLRIYSFSDAVVQHLIDLVQVITDSASKMLCIQGYTKVNWYAKMVRDTGVKINRSLIPAGELGYHIENGKAVLDYDTVEGIDINDKNFFDSTDYDNVGNILIGINEVQIRTAMRDTFVDYIIPFHTGQSGEVLKEKGIDKWQNYKNSQSERNISDGKKSEKQINIYTDVIQRLETEGTPLKNKVQFVEKFLAVCKENGLIPRFSEFLDTNENGDFIYTEGYHKFIIDFKTFHPITGEYLPQMPVKPNFDNEFIKQTLLEFAEKEEAKRVELQPKMDKAIARIEKEVIGTQYSDREVAPLTNDDYKSMKSHFGTTGNYNVAGYLLQDGYMLDFSGKHWGDTTSRTRQVDHRDVSEVIPDSNNGFDSMVRMISNGNIRLMPESGGINLAVAPTKNQRTVLRRYIDYMNQYKKEGLVLDIDAVGGDTIKSFTYEAGTSADRILADIDRHFKGGTQSELMRFHEQYSDRDYMDAVNRGDMETAQKMVDEVAKKNGYDELVFHGTNADKINVFVGNPDRMETNAPNLIKGYFSDQETYSNDFGSNTFRYYINTDNFLFIDGVFDIDEMTEYLARHGVTGVEYNDFISDEDALSSWMEESGDVIDPWMFFNENGGNITERIRNAGYKGVYWSEGYFTEDGGTAYMPFESNLIKSADAVTYDDEGNVIPLSKRFNDEDADIRYSDRDYGYHAGDLGKAEGYWNMVSANRGTGHFGTGTYFVGNEAKISSGNYGKRPHEKVDFSKYNLFRPYTEDEGFELHNALKRINNMMHLYPISIMTFDEMYGIKKGMDNAGYVLWNDESTDAEVEESIAYLEDIRQKYGWYIRNRLRWSDVVEKDVSEMTRDDYEYFADQYEEVYEFLSDVHRDFHSLSTNMTFMLFARHNMRIEGAEARHKQIMQEIYDEVSQIEDAYDAKYEDSPSTRYMKKWGYEGVDVRHLDALDNTTYGSVIYDLKDEDLARKQEIGTAKFSDRDDVSLYETIGEDGRLAEENAKLAEDIAKLASTISGDAVSIKRFRSLADYLKKLAGSNVNRETLGDELKELYEYIQTTPDVQWNNVMAKSYDIARDIMNVFPDVTPNYFKSVMADIRKDKVTLSPNQNSEAVKMFGSYGEFHKRMFGRVNIVNEGTPLAEKWKEWSKKYPTIFDANLTETEQIQALVDILDALKTTSSLMSEYEREEAIRHLATEVYNQFWNIASDVSEDVKKQRADHRKLMEDLRKAYEARQKESTLHPAGEVALKYEQLLRKVKESDAKEKAKIKELGRKRMTDYKDRVAKNAKIERITQKALTLNQWLLKNSKDEHIPEVMKEPVAYLLSAIDFSSKQLLGMRGGERANTPTKKDISLSKALEKVHDMVKGINDAQIGEDDISTIYGTFADFPVGFADDVKLLSGVANDILRKAGDNAFILNDMTLEQLEEFDRIITTLKTTVTKMNKFLAIRHAEGVANMSQQDIVYLDSLGKRKTYDGKIGGIDKMLQWGNSTPYYAFKRFGEGGKKVMDAIMNGWDKYAFHVNDIIGYTEQTYTSKEAKEWAEDIKEFDILVPPTEAERASKDYEPQYQKVKMSVPQIMALYCTVKRAQAKTHLFGGGMRVADIKGKNGVISQPDGAILTESELEKITSTLTDRQREVADALQRFMNTTCSDWGNDVSMIRFGIKQFGEENYFPIQSDRNNLAVDDETERNNSLFRLLNMSFTKSLTEGANNRIVIGDIFDVFAQHASDMAKYNALALPILDAFKWYNYKEKVKRGKDTQFTTMSLKQSLETAFGKDAQSYITTFLKDINGAESGGRDSVGGGFFTNAKIASVGFNARVIALQPTSYVRANAVIDPKYLAKAFMHKPKYEETMVNGKKKKVLVAEKYCGIALWKSLGFFDINIQKSVTTIIKHDQTTKDKLVEASMKGAEKADKLTWGYLWNACEIEVREKNPNLVGEELYQKVGLRLREVIYSTQVVDSTVTRSQMMRSKDGRDKMITAFMSEPTLAYNMLQDAYYDWKLTERQTGSKEKAFKKHGKKMARVFTAYAVTNMLSALVEAGFDVFRDTDDEEITFEDFIKQWLKNFGSNMSILNKIPYAKEIVSFLEGYSSSRTDTQWMQYIATFGSGIVKLLEGKGNAYKTANDGLKAFSYFTGLPMYNAWRDLTAFGDKVGFEVEELEEMFNDTIGSIFPSLKSK